MSTSAAEPSDGIQCDGHPAGFARPQAAVGLKPAAAVLLGPWTRLSRRRSPYASPGRWSSTTVTGAPTDRESAGGVAASPPADVASGASGRVARSRKPA